MQTAKEHGIIFNSVKCQIRQPQIASYGAVFTVQGMWSDPSKPQALQELPAPDSQVKLYLFLGLVKYLQPFLPGLSTKTMLLCEQLAEWDWNTVSVKGCFKAWICETLLNATLTYYDISKPVIVQTGTSKYQLGAVLTQSSHPIAFSSKTLTDIETHYRNIE